MSNGENVAFNIGDIIFQVFPLLFIAFIVTSIVIAFRMIRKKTNGIEKNRG